MVAHLQHFRVTKSPDKRASVWINLCAYYVAHFPSCEKQFSVMWPKHCKNSLCWVGIYIKLGCELIPHFSRVVSLHYNYSSKKYFRVFCILYFSENPRHNKGDKGGIQSLPKCKKKWTDFLSEYSRVCHLHGSPAGISWCAPKCASSPFSMCL